MEVQKENTHQKSHLSIKQIIDLENQAKKGYKSHQNMFEHQNFSQTKSVMEPLKDVIG